MTVTPSFWRSKAQARLNERQRKEISIIKYTYKTKVCVEERRERFDGIEEAFHTRFRQVITADSYADAVQRLEEDAKQSGWTITRIKIMRV